MDDVWTLLLLSLAMLLGCYLAGSIPLACTLSEEKLKLVSVMGAGLLVGTALAVIIPEGVHTLCMAQCDTHEHLHHAVVKAVEKAAERTVAVASKVSEHVNQHTDPKAADHQHTGHGRDPDLHSYIGVSLVLGFVFMLLVDQLSGGRGHSHGRSSTGVEGETSDQGHVTDNSDLVDSHCVGDELGGVVTQHRNNMTATVGLVVHAAADGVALGAAASMSQTHVEMIVFIAIMLHKAPAAFGLVSFLLHDGFDRNRIRRHLAVFSTSAPIFAVITYFSLSQQSKEVLDTVNLTGIAMLFSAGTFLYVATVHVLPELQSMGTTRTTCADGTVLIREQKGFTKLELFLMVVGALLPLVLSIGHHH